MKVRLSIEQYLSNAARFAGSELATHYWLQNISGLGELIGYDFESMSLDRIYQVLTQSHLF